jgi:hypothetical protein
MKRHHHSFNHLNTNSKHQKMLNKLDRLIENWEEARNTDTALFFRRPAQVIRANLVIGISRGIGFVLGASIFGAIALTILGWILSRFVSLPIIGKYVAMIIANAQHYLTNGGNF